MQHRKITILETSELTALARAWGLKERSVAAEVIRLVSKHPLTWRTALELDLWAARIEAGAETEAIVFITRERQEAMAREACIRVRAGILLPHLLQLLRARLRRGFFFPPATHGIEDSLTALRRGEIREPARFLRSFFKSFWLADDGPAAWSTERPEWEKVLLDRAGVNTRGEVFDLTWAEVRRSLRVHRHLVSFFQPSHAYTLYKDLCDTPAPTVWDPSCGFGARLLGFYAAHPRGTYLGNEPATSTFSDLSRLAHEAGFSTARIYNAGSETPDRPNGPFDLVFTSPPYFDKERYFDEPSQSFLRFETRKAWLDGFMGQIVEHALQQLRSEGVLALNVDWDLSTEVAGCVAEKAAALQIDVQTLPTRELPVRVHHFTKNGRANEPVLIWRKK